MHAVAFSEDGSLLATGTSGGVVLWSPDTGALLGTLSAPAATQDATVNQLTFVPDTPYLAGITISQPEIPLC